MDRRNAELVFMIKGPEALKPENAIGMFERLKGRRATEEERQTMINRLSWINAPEGRRPA